MGCIQCSFLIKVAHPITGERFYIKNNFTCNSSFVIYAILCPLPPYLQYVGKTTQKVVIRWVGVTRQQQGSP